MNKWKKAGKILLCCVLGIILIINIAVICLEYKNGPEALKDAPYALLTIDGGSMEPKYHAGDGIFVWQTPFSQLETGDVIVFLQNGELITHEISAIEDGVVTAKGTANDIEDEPVTEENYRAKVLFKIPGIVNLQNIYESPVAFGIFALLLLLLFFGKDIFNKVYERFF